MSEPTEAAEWKWGSTIVVASAMAYGTGPLLFLTTASVFMRPIMESTGWSTSQVLLSPLVIVLFTFMGPVVGRLADRKGVRHALLIGVLPYAALLILFATMPISLVSYYAVAVGIGLFGAFGYQIPFNRAVASWFDKGAGKAFGIVGVGGAAMPLVGIPLVTLAIYKFGWQAGYLVLAGFALLAALPAVLFGVRERPHRAAAPDSIEGRTVVTADHVGIGGVSAGQIMRTFRFWVFAIHIFFVGGAASGFLSNMQPLLLDGGLDVAMATTATTLFTTGIILGRLGAGFLMDMFDRYRVAVSVFAISLIGALVLANVESLPFFLIGLAALLTAAGQGAEGDIGAYFILKEYGQSHFGTLYAFAGIFGGAGALIVPYAFGILRDVTGDYSAAAYLGALLYAFGSMAIILFGLLGHKRKTPVSVKSPGLAKH